MKTLPCPGSLSARMEPAVRLDDRSGDGEADAGAHRLPWPCAADRPGRSARTGAEAPRRGCRHRCRRRSPRPSRCEATGLDAHLAALGREPHRVVDEIEDDLMHALGVGLDRGQVGGKSRSTRRTSRSVHATSISEHDPIDERRERRPALVRSGTSPDSSFERSRSCSTRRPSRSDCASITSRVSRSAAPPRRAGSRGARGSP